MRALAKKLKKLKSWRNLLRRKDLKHLKLLKNCIKLNKNRRKDVKI